MNRYGPFPSWTSACRGFFALIRDTDGAAPLIEMATPLLGVHRAIELVDQFRNRGVIEQDGGTIAAPLWRYTGRPFGWPGVDGVGA